VYPYRMEKKEITHNECTKRVNTEIHVTYFGLITKWTDKLSHDNCHYMICV